MMSEKEFISGVWEKYLRYQENTFKDKFFKINIKKEIPLRIMKIAAMCLLSVGIGTFAYTEIINNRNDIEQILTNYTPTYNEETGNYDNFYRENESDGNISFKKITSYGEYLEFINKYGAVIDASEKDFVDDFILVVEAYENMYISDIYNDNITLFVKLKMDLNTIPNQHGFISTKISRELDRENIEIEIIPEISNSDDYVSIQDLPDNYMPEDAISDGYVVVGKSEIMTESLVQENIKKLDEFIENTKLGNKDYIRLVNFKENHTVYTDIIFQNSVYNVSLFYKFTNNEESFTTFYTGTEFSKTCAGNAIRYRLYEDSTHTSGGYVLCYLKAKK